MMILAAVLFYSLMIALEMGGMMVAKYKWTSNLVHAPCLAKALKNALGVSSPSKVTYGIMRLYFYRKDME